MEKLYLVPKVTTCSGLIIEYEMRYEKVDMRKNTNKYSKKIEVNPITLINLIDENHVKVKGDRLALISGNFAYKFARAIEQK